MRRKSSVLSLIYLFVRSISGLAPLAIALSYSSTTPPTDATTSNLNFPSSQQQQQSAEGAFCANSVDAGTASDYTEQDRRQQQKMQFFTSTEAPASRTAVAVPAVGTEEDMNGDGNASAAVASCDGADGPVPQRYLLGCNGDTVEAARRWRETCKWRRANEVDTVIERPQPRFYDCREVFPVYVHGRSKAGLPVLWEQIGRVNLPRAGELKLPLSDLLPNYVFINECIWRVVLDKGEDKNDDAQFITVEDVEGVGLWHLTPRVLGVVRSLTGTMKAHYVERCYKSYIINAPRAFTALWRIISPMLDPRTRAKVSILGTDYAAALREEIDPSQLPTEYGGTSGRSINESDDELKIQSLVARLSAQQGGEEGKPPSETENSSGTATAGQQFPA